MFEYHKISEDFPSRRGIRFGCESSNREYKANYSIKRRFSAVELMQDFDALLFCYAKVDFCIKPGTLPLREEIELRLVEMADAVENKGLAPSASFQAVNDLLFDLLKTL